MGRLRGGRPLPFAPEASRQIAIGVELAEHEDGSGMVFLHGMASWCWAPGDAAGRRLAAVQLVETRSATAREVAAGFSVAEPTLWRWRDAYARRGVAGLSLLKKGPRRPSKLDASTVAEIVRLHHDGRSSREVAAQVGVSHSSVLRALGPAPEPGAPVSSALTDLVVLAPPATRAAERAAARLGLLEEAAPVITEGASLPLAGALVVLPALAATGLLEVAAAIYGAGRKVKGAPRSCFYGLRSLVLSVVFSCLLGEPRAEGVTRIDPRAIGRLLGLDRAPEVSRLRFRLAELAGEKKADKLVEGLAARHVAEHLEAVALLYVDGHVRAYNGKKEIPKAHVARMRIAMPAEVDTWVADRFGDGLLVWQAPPGASLAGELRAVCAKVRELLGPEARPTICFDRGGWSPKLFAQLDAAGFDILTYRKAPLALEEERAFKETVFIDEQGRAHTYLLADRKVELAYDNGRQSFSCRQITRLDKATKHQTQVITTRRDPDPTPVAYAMFGRWQEENFFKYMRAHFGLDALDAYESISDDPTRLVANPARRQADRTLDEARRSLARAQMTEGKAAVQGRPLNEEVAVAFVAASAEVERLAEEAKAIPAKVPLGEVRPSAVRLDVERKRLMDAIRMATYNAESSLARLLAPHYARANDEARSLLREIYKSSADLEIIADELHVRVLPLSAPRRTRALAGLCEELSSTKTRYPGTNLTLVFSVKEG